MTRLNHIAVAVKDLEQAVATYERMLGVPCMGQEDVATEGVRVAFFDLGGPRLELVAPLSNEGGVARRIAKSGEGLHHICLEVDGLDARLEALKAEDVPLIHDTPVPGAHGTRVAFAHPKGAHGVLIELVDAADGHSDGTGAAAD